MLLPFFEWCESLWLGQFVVGSNWLFPVIEAIHLLFLSLLGGAVLVVDLRLLGLGLKSKTPSELWRAARPWMIGAIAGMIATGIPLFLSEPIKCYYNDSFWVKMTTLPIAIVFAFTIRSGAVQDAVRNTARCRLRSGSWWPLRAAGSASLRTRRAS
jgi:hypothetical protein